MATMLALIVSTLLAYLPSMLFGDSMSVSTQLMVSTIIGFVSFVWLKWYFRRLRGD